MADGLSSANMATIILNLFRATNATAPVASYVKLYTGSPGATGAANAAVGSTTRVAVTFAAPAGNAIALTGGPYTWTNGGTSETLTDIGVWDAAAAGNFDYSAALTSGQAWASTNTFTLTTLG